MEAFGERGYLGCRTVRARIGIPIRPHPLQPPLTAGELTPNKFLKEESVATLRAIASPTIIVCQHDPSEAWRGVAHV
jgi:hypothetical protein